MPCEVVTPRGPCRMPPLKGEACCFAHNPKTQAARSAARTKGGTNKGRRSPTPLPAPSAPPPAAFDLGELQRHADVAPALLRLARAIASGGVDPRRGRLLTEALRAAASAFNDSPDVADNGVPLGAREPTLAELAHMRKTGELPEGVEIFGTPTFWVTGDPWKTMADDGAEN